MYDNSNNKSRERERERQRERDREWQIIGYYFREREGGEREREMV